MITLKPHGISKETKVKRLERLKTPVSVFFSVVNYSFVRVISIVETILDLVSPSRGGISAVPIAIFVTLRSFMNRLLVISATSTAVVIACPRAFRVISLPAPEENAVMIAST